MRIALVEDNMMLARAVARVLRDAGHAVDWLDDGAAGDAFLRSAGADLAILDVNLPGLDGVSIVRAMRARRDPTPVLMLTARSDTADRVTGLDAGADDYLTKPFAMDELLARIRALARRRGDPAQAVETIGGLRFDRMSRTLRGDAGPIDLTRRETALFETLMDHAGRVISKETLSDALYGTGAEVEPNAIELLVSRLRRKLGGTGCEIRTARGLGYMLDAEDARR
jgi:two-component system OmpR family response regulator